MSDATKRDRVEARLLEIFGENLKALDDSAIPLINTHKDGSFGRSYLAYQLYTNGHNAHSSSTHHPRGLYYHDGDTLFGVGAFFQPGGDPDTPCIHLVAPHGAHCFTAVERFCDALGQKMPEAVVYVRQLPLDRAGELVRLESYEQLLGLGDSLKAQQQILRDMVADPQGALSLPHLDGEPGSSVEEKLKSRMERLEGDIDTMMRIQGALHQALASISPWRPVDFRPWHPEAKEEDETYKSSAITLKDVIREPSKGMFNNIEGLELSGNSRDMARRNYNGFHNFLERNDLEYMLHPYDASQEAGARALVEAHFRRLEGTGKAIGSTAADYQNLLTTFPEKAAEAGLHMYVGYLGQKGRPETRRPVSFFGFEELGGTGPRACGGYATITTYDPAVLDGLSLKGATDDDRHRGFRNIATYAMGTVLHALKEKGVEVVKLGGSETPDLDKGKQKLGAKLDPTIWSVRIPADKWSAMVQTDGPPTPRTK
jgi:hypothetical protein